VRGKRCLDVGTYDGFYAFEMERRGAAEVVATDIPENEDWDFPAAVRLRGVQALREAAGEKGLGFEAAKAALGSNVEKRLINAYHLSPEEMGTFDVVVCGSLLLHLRDPVRALESIRSVCSGWFMSVEEVSLGLSVRFPRRSVADARFDEALCQWWVLNAAGHRRMAEIAGFEVTESSGVFCEPFGQSHPERGRGARAAAIRLSRRVFAGGDGVPHAAVLARPRIQAPPIKV